MDCEDPSLEDSGSTGKINSKGLRGPCHVPLEREQYYENILFVTADAFE